MKKYVLFLFVSLIFAVSYGQEASSFELSEEESTRITESFEFNNLINYQLRFLEVVNGALSQGIPLNKLRNAARESLESGDDEIFCRMIFTDTESGRRFLENFSSAKKQLIESNQVLTENREVYACTSCKKSITEEADAFFNMFDKYRVSKPLFENAEQSELQQRNGYTCGSAWNRVKLIMCTATCAIPSGLLATAFCGWSCWCWFCSENSELGSIICAD
jgi:hypothetical protein